MKNVVYGAGFYGELFCRELEVNGIKIDCIIDQYTSKKELFGKSIKRLNELDLKNTNIYISITSPLIEKIVYEQLQKLTNKKVFSFIDTLTIYSSLIEKCLILSNCWYSKEKSKMLDYEKLSSFKTLLKDDKSLKLLEKIIKFRETLDPQYYLTPDLEPQYFPSDINLFEKIDSIRFVDGGAYRGDTLESSLMEFQKLNKKLDYIISFEPDTSNIKKLNTEILKQKENFKDINFLVYPCGLWSSNSILTFSNNNQANSSLVNDTSENKIQIMTVSLDDTLIGSSPNYIKLDIEGAERESILGMKDIIKKESPTLAICLYHKPHDLWDLPLLINEINSNYDMYLRIYGSLGLELVLYCVPKK
ncbi:FkbM family methyltransferase [Aliarcobacter lanthieri]|uniref:FkbM family methyltransferase n=1 Tax=Aliarcobacter lanthieri TaxID=1355374 RepID=UPI003AA8F041